MVAPNSTERLPCGPSLVLNSEAKYLSAPVIVTILSSKESKLYALDASLYNCLCLFIYLFIILKKKYVKQSFLLLVFLAVLIDTMTVSNLPIHLPQNNDESEAKEG